MQIVRSGSSANHGRKSITFKASKASWDARDSVVTIKQQNVKDFSTTAHHDYVVSISPEEVAMILEVVASAALDNPALFEERMSVALKSVVQLQAVLAGVART